jgi:hypothetical protein
MKIALSPRLCALLLLYQTLYHRANAQPSPPPVSDAVLAYTNSTCAEIRLYNGPLYLGYDHHAKGHPFFLSDTLQTASAEYDGIFYPRLKLSYDLVKDVVIMPNPSNTVLLQLLSEKLSSFTMASHHFIFLQPDSNAQKAPDAGFYELLYNGKVTALAHYVKMAKNQGKAEEDLASYLQYDTWYLVRNTRFFAIRTNKKLLDACGAAAGATRTFLRRNNLSFHKDPAKTLARTAEFLSQNNY